MVSFQMHTLKIMCTNIQMFEREDYTEEENKTEIKVHEMKL